MTEQQETGLTPLEDILDTARRLAEELSLEKQNLQQRVAELEEQLQALKERVAREPTTPPPPLAGEEAAAYVAGLRAEFAQLETQHRELEQEFAHLERQNWNYLSLYVASSQIHATLVLEDVLQNIKEIIINLIGSDRFAIYLYNESAREFRRMASQGELDPADEIIPFGDNLLSRVARSGTASVDVSDANLPSGRKPIAVLPMTVGQQSIGLVVLFRLLVQKSDFDALDTQLFELLAAHAATALMSSSMYRRLERKNKTLHGLLDLFKAGGAPGAAAEE
jgi:hypothetical protein